MVPHNQSFATQLREGFKFNWDNLIVTQHFKQESFNGIPVHLHGQSEALMSKSPKWPCLLSKINWWAPEKGLVGPAAPMGTMLGISALAPETVLQPAACLLLSGDQLGSTTWAIFVSPPLKSHPHCKLLSVPLREGQQTPAAPFNGQKKKCRELQSICQLHILPFCC